jgi:glycosyltransferase involved in cell wall biosynthesis
LESFRIAKGLKLVKFLFLELVYLLRWHFDFCCYPISYNRNAFLKDWVLLGLARIFRVPVVLYAHGRGVSKFRESLPPPVARRFDAMVKNSAGVIVIATDLKEEFAGLVEQKRVFVVTHGIEPQPQLKLLAAEERREEIVVLYLGALVVAKGVFDLLQAVPLVRARTNVRFVLAGQWWKADDENAARKLIADANLQNAVDFVGPVEGAAKWRFFLGADIFVFPPHPQTEAFGMVLLEAMQVGLPIVATRGGARSEIIADGVNGLLVEEQNPRDLAEKILRLADDPELRARMGCANQQRFAEYYTHEHYGKRMIAVFERLLDGPAAK